MISERDWLLTPRTRVDDLIDACRSVTDNKSELVDELIAQGDTYIERGDGRNIEYDVRRAAVLLSPAELEEYTLALGASIARHQAGRDVSDAVMQLAQSPSATPGLRRALCAMASFDISLFSWMVIYTDSDPELQQALVDQILELPHSTNGTYAAADAARARHLTATQWERLRERSEHEPKYVRDTLAQHPVAPPEILADWYSSGSNQLQRAVLYNPHCPLPILLDAANAPRATRRREIACCQPRVIAFYGHAEHPDAWNAERRQNRTAAQIDAATRATLDSPAA